MKIRINEKQYIKLNEAVGVPTNIVEVARQLYEKIMSELNPDDDLETQFNKPIIFKGDFQIGNYKFKKIKIYFKLEDLNDYTFTNIEKPKVLLSSMTHHGKVEMNAKFNYEVSQNLNTVTLSIIFAVDNDTTSQDVINEFKKEKVVMISSFAHELKHAYDESVNSLVQTHKRVDYKIGNERRFGDILPLNKFLNYMYFAHTTENLVRASEIFAALEENGITKKDFYNFITNHKTYTMYKEGSELTYEGLRNELKSIVPNIKKTFDDNGIYYPKNISDDDMVSLTLLKFFETLLNWKAGIMNELLSNNFLEMMLGFSGGKQKYFENYLKKIGRFGGDYEKYFKYEINQIRYICRKMMKKISKLYSLINEKNPSE